MIISVVNDTDLQKEEVQRVLRAVNRQLAEDYRRYWHKEVQLRLEGWTGEQPDPRMPFDIRGDAVLYLWDKQDLDEALGYHSLTARGIPFGFVLTRLAGELGRPWSVILSHEALELAADPEANLLCSGSHPDPEEGGRTVYHWYEICDAVQGHSYSIDGVDVANFLLPLYFTVADEHRNHNDFLGTGIRSFGVGPGGYAGYLDPATGRHERFQGPGDEKAERARAAKQRFGVATRGQRRQREEHRAPGSGADAVALDALTFQLEGGTLRGEAQDLVARVLGAGWQVHPVPGSPGEFDARPPASARLGFGEAWELAHQLAEVDEVRGAEASVSYPVPGESDVPPESPRAVRAALGGGHRPGTERHQWALELCGVVEAWSVSRALGKEPGAGVLVGHPDSGYRRHSEMDAARVRDDIDRDFIEGDDDAASTNHKGNHGLATASVIMSGVGMPGDRLAGAAPVAHILPLRVTKPGLLPAPVLFSAGLRRLRDAIRYAVAQHCDVISISLGAPYSSPSVKKAIREAREAGLVLLAAAGNEVTSVTFPANYHRVVAVAGCNIDRRPWAGSCRGPEVDLSAPAESVWRAYWTDAGKESVGRSNGTSYAVALTAGVAALWVSLHGRRALKTRYGGPGVQEAFLHLAQKHANRDHRLPDGQFGAGIVDAKALLEAPLPDPAELLGNARRASAFPSERRLELPPSLAAERSAADGLERFLAAAATAAPLGAGGSLRAPSRVVRSVRLRRALDGAEANE